jgi:gluconokinase
MKPSFVLAIDMGTSSTRSAIYDAKGRRFAVTTAQVKYPLLTGQDGRAELRPADIERAVEKVVAKTLAAWKKKSDAPIAAIGVSCFWHSLLGLDANGRAITPIYTWADSRCRNEARRLRDRNAEKAIHARTGCMARTSFWPSKLLWLRRTDPRLFRRVARWVSPAEWIQEKFCDRSSASLSMASGTGLLNGKTGKWDAALLHRCGLNEARLNPISDESIVVSRSGAKKFSALTHVPWYPAIGDGAASNLGSGATSPGLAAINVGTSAALRVVVTKKARAPFGLFSYRIDMRRPLLGGAVSNAGNLRAWARRELKLPDDAAIELELSKRTAPVEKLTLLPFLIAERAPTWPEELPSAIIGMTQATSALDLLQALQEATYHRLAQIAEEIERAVGSRLAFIVSGGIQHSANSLQRLADVLGRPVYASTEPEASLRGAACFALEKLGIKPPPPKRGRAIRPRAGSAGAYAQARQVQVRLEKLLRASDIASLGQTPSSTRAR